VVTTLVACGEVEMLLATVSPAPSRIVRVTPVAGSTTPATPSSAAIQTRPA
jgi:hypothetical protein